MKKNFYVILSILGIIGGIVTFFVFNCSYVPLSSSLRDPTQVKFFCYISMLVGSAALVASILFYRRFVYLKLNAEVSILVSIIIICCSLYFISNGEDLPDYRKQYYSKMNDAGIKIISDGNYHFNDPGGEIDTIEINSLETVEYIRVQFGNPHHTRYMKITLPGGNEVFILSDASYKLLKKRISVYCDRSFIKSYNAVFFSTNFFGIFYLLFSLYCLYKIKSSNKKNDNKEISTDNQNELK